MGQLVVKCIQGVKRSVSTTRNGLAQLVHKTFRLTKTGLGKFGSVFKKPISRKNRSKKRRRQTEIYKNPSNKNYSPDFVTINPRTDFQIQGENQVYQNIEMEYDPEPDPDAGGHVTGNFDGFVYNEGSLNQLMRIKVLTEIDILNAGIKVSHFFKGNFRCLSMTI